MQERRKRTTAERLGNDRGWLAAQFTLLGLTSISGPAGALLGWHLPMPWPFLVNLFLGLLLIAGAFIVAVQAQSDLGDSLRVAPTPLEDAELVERGWYGRVRHPLYLTVLMGVWGWTILWLNYLSVLVAVSVVLFLHLKSRHEERMLRATYPGYADYMARVQSRFVPKIW